MNSGRRSGILLHITSLPGPFGIGDLGPESRRFSDLLQEAKQRVWCVLPLGPAGEENSPYKSPSAFAGNTLMISPELLAEEGYVPRRALKKWMRKDSNRADFEWAARCKEALLQQAFRGFSATKEYAAFVSHNKWWLEGYARFQALRQVNDGRAWTRFDARLSPDEEVIGYHKFAQYEFYRQWNALRAACRERDIRLMGDMPFYIEHDSADVWSNPQLFDLQDLGEAATVGGVPPDYFSSDGQLWGTPTYRWEEMEKDDFRWWVDRFRNALATVDLLRLDHFRGFEAFWSIPAGDKTAKNGHWRKGPGARLFEIVKEKLGEVPFVAENLGIITAEVEAIRKEFHFPGMAVLQFGFGEDGTHRPNNYVRELVAFTGTHDNDTTRGWWSFLERSARKRKNSSDRETLRRVKSYLQTNGKDIHWNFIQALLTSVADTAVIPLQDVLGLGTNARMNVPGRAKGNWSWRATKQQMGHVDVDRLRELTSACERG